MARKNTNKVSFLQFQKEKHTSDKDENENILTSPEKIILSGPDWDLFYDALVHPPAPNDALQNAWLRYQEANYIK